ncbi:hypothetical protein ACE1OC_43200 (plasmid) [Streptomyces sp. DSM 116496]|uniref:hypothetical protein n=1 Tax=Streptomyces stoeckheimensis TaxID=3344656 RepID=UPI0038B2B5EC
MAQIVPDVPRPIGPSRARQLSARFWTIVGLYLFVAADLNDMIPASVRPWISGGILLTVLVVVVVRADRRHRDGRGRR